jgi:hypothetical protein
MGSNLNSRYKENYVTMNVQIDIVREKSIGVSLFTKSGDLVSVQTIPRRCLSYACQQHFGNIMTFPVTRDIEVAKWFHDKEFK